MPWMQLALAMNRVRLNPLHKYLYANGNPITNIDPSGHFIPAVIVAVGVGMEIAGAAVAAYGLVEFTVSAYGYYQTSVALGMVDRSTDFVRYMCLEYSLEKYRQGMINGALCVGSGALSFGIGAWIKAAGLARMAVAASGASGMAGTAMTRNERLAVVFNSIAEGMAQGGDGRRLMIDLGKKHGVDFLYDLGQVIQGMLMRGNLNAFEGNIVGQMQRDVNFAI